jgi:hypothetical protein
MVIDKHRLQDAMDTASDSRIFLRLQAVFLFIEGMDIP